MNRSRWQFSMRVFLALVAGIGITIAAIQNIPHVVIFLLVLACFVMAYWCTYRSVKSSKWGRASVSGLALLIFVAAMYVLSIGPFIAFSEFESKVTGFHALKRAAVAYRPVMVLYSGPFRWYVDQWIPAKATGVRATLPPEDALAPLVGTWKGEKGNVLNFRADGTAWSRSSSGSQIQFFEWTLNDDKFLMWFYGSRQNAVTWFGQAVMQLRPTSQFRLVKVTDDELQLRDVAQGSTHRFTPTRDAELDMLP
jgi:hypothetical protein